MQLPKLLRTSVFQLTLVYMALFGVSVIALFGFIYWSTLGYLERQTNATIQVEIDGLLEQYERRNLQGLADVIAERVRRDDESRSLYLLADAIGRPLAGNVQNWPPALDGFLTDQWVDFVRTDDNGMDTPVRAGVMRIGPGFGCSWAATSASSRKSVKCSAARPSTGSRSRWVSRSSAAC
jgi:hypothetical protein